MPCDLNILGGNRLRRSVDSWLDRFCYKHPKLGIPGLMKYIVFGNAIVYLLDIFSSGYLSLLLSFNLPLILRGEIWRLVTFIFLPLDSNALFLILSLYFYWFIGTTLEREWGSVKFTVFYLVGYLLTLGAGLVIGSTPLGALLGGMVNMFYVNMSMFFAFASLYPDMQMLLFFIIPVKVKWLAWLDVALFVINCARYVAGGMWVLCLLPLVAVGNWLLFFWGDIMERLGRVQYQHSRQTVNFKQATRQAREQKGYIHKCAVCGKTDTEFPNEEFRYCSKCNGYYCYCSEHINNHVHIE